MYIKKYNHVIRYIISITAFAFFTAIFGGLSWTSFALCLAFYALMFAPLLNSKD